MVTHFKIRNDNEGRFEVTIFVKNRTKCYIFLHMEAYLENWKEFFTPQYRPTIDIHQLMKSSRDFILLFILYCTHKKEKFEIYKLLCKNSNLTRWKNEYMSVRYNFDLFIDNLIKYYIWVMLMMMHILVRTIF